jgi:hypothetical protein
MRRTAVDRFCCQSLVVPNGKSGALDGAGVASRNVVSVVMNVAMPPRVPCPFCPGAPSRPSELPVKVTAPLVSVVYRVRYCAEAGCAHTRIASTTNLVDQREDVCTGSPSPLPLAGSLRSAMTAGRGDYMRR